MHPTLPEETAANLLKGITIPPQPQIMVDLQLEVLELDPSFDRIAQIITKDAGIAGCILKVINSPFFQLRSQVTSISQALNLLGITNIISIVNSVSIRDSLSDEQILELTRFWDNATDVAMAAAAISRLTGISAPHEAYTLGLFHNCGIPLLMAKQPNYLEILQLAYTEPVRNLTEIENREIATNHAVIGYFVAKAWKLPNYLAYAIADHHKTGSIFTDEVQCDKQEKNLLATLKLAEHICKTSKVLGNVSTDFEFNRIKIHLLEYLGISEYDFDDLRKEVVDLCVVG